MGNIESRGVELVDPVFRHRYGDEGGWPDRMGFDMQIPELRMASQKSHQAGVGEIGLGLLLDGIRDREIQEGRSTRRLPRVQVLIL
jgi:hypothetical protein